MCLCPLLLLPGQRHRTPQASYLLVTQQAPKQVVQFLAADKPEDFDVGSTTTHSAPAMEAIREQLQRLNSEVDDENAKLGDVVKQLHKNPQGEILKLEYSRIVQTLAELRACRKNLEDKLQGAAAGADPQRLGAGAGGSAESTLLEAVKKLVEEVQEDNKEAVKKLERQNKKMVKKTTALLEREIVALGFRATGSSRPPTSVYREPCMAAYNGADYAQKEHLQCLLTGREFPARKVKGGHIFRLEWRNRQLLAKAGLDINGPENVIPIYDTVEEMLDQQRITIEPTAPGPPIFTVRVLDKSLLQPGQWIVHTDDVRMLWSELDGRVLDFGGMDFGDKGPPLSALLCAIHMRAALLTAENEEWIEKLPHHLMMNLF
ncbi:hypothetical protein VOLCADRAFT_107253 [Volvox carteri f. nagariensis]|uniref:HNH nuclease domain-containing protein n=1 Tax=Volvox carteri f. nagariensis TaxID=3068 RepID=D8UCV2_VOLCA|nr:uncharacterized protein VOLCADRAFT_107253 [Volvox carteri f. nagariensis]EFJ42455.1 hypothetical protein VOLCADRAFT_107253 [Volvox carteri f. nagariensis]|eukprot:XP_002956518.1 hypothetical protein VOLCADRAFT_107253 [Volvox carteri f. nagariensis]